LFRVPLLVVAAVVEVQLVEAKAGPVWVLPVLVLLAVRVLLEVVFNKKAIPKHQWKEAVGVVERELE
jgi:hypothetical protein